MARVEIDHVDKTWPGGARALVDVCLQVGDGELLVCVGPSGCGKSTLLRLVAGLEEPTRGTLRIGGRVVNGLSPQERNVAMVFQEYALYPHMTVRRNLEFPLRMRGQSRTERGERVARVAALLGIEGLLERRPAQLSGGQRQRVAMGRALVREPTVFLLDEPLSNLDARMRVDVREEIGELQRRTRTTMLYVTHDQVEAMTLGDRVAVLHEGALQQVAPAHELYERPANTFVAGFVGNPPMNLFPASLRPPAAGRSRLAVGGQSLEAAPAGVPPERLAAWAGRTLTAGLRPEALRLAAESGDALRASVLHVEHLGHETLLHVRVAGGEGAEGPVWVARLPGMREFGRGDAVALAADPRQVHLFDEEGVALGG